MLKPPRFLAAAFVSLFLRVGVGRRVADELCRLGITGMIEGTESFFIAVTAELGPAFKEGMVGHW